MFANNQVSHVMPTSRPQAPARFADSAKSQPAAGLSKPQGRGAKKPKFTHASELPVESPKIREMARETAARNGYKWALRLIILICLGGLLKVTVQETIVKNPQFALLQVRVETSGPVTHDKLARSTLLTRGENLLFINMHEVRARLHQLPSVKEVALERNFDAGVLTLRVKQRQPVAWIQCPRLGMPEPHSGFGWLVDAEGVTFTSDKPAETYEGLPIIHHEILAQNTPGVTLDDHPLSATLSLLAELDRRHEDGHPQVRAFVVRTPWSVHTLFSDKTQVIFGVDDLELQLARLDRVRHEARERHWQVDTLNLAVMENVPITFRSPPDLASLSIPTAAIVRAIPITNSSTSQR